MIKKLCEGFMARAEAQNYKKGIRRERAAIEFMAGAATAIIADKGEESPEAKQILNWIVWHMMIEGYAAIEKELKKT
jgi:hypothetical protein